MELPVLFVQHGLPGTPNGGCAYRVCFYECSSHLEPSGHADGLTVDQIFEAGAYLLAGIGFGHAGTLLLWDRGERKARKQAAPDAEVSWRAIDGLLESWRAK